MKNKKINSKKNYKSILKKSSVLLGAMALSFGIIALNFKGENPAFSKYRDHYNSDLAYIKESTIPSDSKYITMTQAANGARPVISDNPELSQKISISTFDELIKFSTLLNDDDSYLAYDYALIANIQCDGSHDFVPVGYKTNKAFSGTFDGQGYEILDLQLSGNIPSEMVYYGMFSVNSGTITNVGLTDPILTISSPTDNLKGAGGVAYLCGYNTDTGTISNSFVVDDSTEQNVAGITAYDCRIADLCVKNSGSLTDDYVAVDVVVNQQSTSAEYAEIVLNNTGSMNKCYYYNNSISMISGSRTIYKDSYNLKDKTILPAGTNKTKKDLINTLNTDGWYTSSSYGDLSTYVPISYGVRRGLSYTNSTKTFTVANPKDYAYMYELFNLDDYMASDKITYQITGDINLGVLPVESYTYTKSIGASIIGATNVANSKTKLITNNATTYPTIYNAKILDKSRMTKSVGVDCYGLFNFVTGKIKNLNVYATGLNLNDIKQNNENVKGIGVLAGYVEQGIIENVNVYAEFTNVTDSNHETVVDLGEYYLGGITGILGGAGVISNSSANGSMNLVSRSNTISESQYMSGIAIGGIVGYVESSLGNVSNSTSAVDITSMLGTSTSYAIGGVIGAGYTTNYNYVENDLNQSVKTSNLENVGDITVGNSSNNTYSSLYVAGIIGRHLGVTAQVEGFNNVGKINVYANGSTTYVSGCENADILSSSQFRNNAGQPLFYASAFTNGEIVTVAGSSANLQYTNVLNLNAGNGIVSKLEGIFNLAYNEKYDETSSATNLTKTSTAIAAQEISMNLINQFAPVLNVIGGTSVYKTEANMVYNLRDINYTLSTDISSATTFNYTGVALGNYITYNDVRNEGNLTVTFNAGISTTSTLKVSGIFDTLNLGCTASNLFNGGNITINESNGSSANKKIDMYLSGICYQNASVDDSQLQNPLNANFDESLLGTLSNVINNGDITVESDYLEKGVNINSTPSTTPHFISNIYVGGITYLNNGIISDAFNLGNVNVAVYTLSGNTGKYYEAGGITCVMDGEYAQIRDAANNGDLYVVDITNKSYKSTVNVGGIIARNCQLNRTTSAGNNNKQVVAFTINYGTLNAYQSASNMSTVTTIANCHSSAGGILGCGICNLVDIVNYGNVYASECSAGIVALVRLGTYNDSNTINLANTINYGQVKINPQFYATQLDNNVYQTYNSVVSLEHIENANIYYKNTYTGSICTVFDFSSKENINVRFLINLYKDAKTVLYNLNTPTNKPDVSTFITTAGLVDTFGDNPTYIKYAPLTTVEDEYGNIGAFSSRFVFRRAINKDSEIYQPSTYTTDKYIPEFFQFVVFDKVNSSLLQSIGWETIAYQSAAEQLVKNVGALATLINVSNKTNLLSDAFESNTWLSTIDDELFNSLLNESLECGELSENIESILDYVLFDTTATSSYTTEIRTKIVEKILKYYEKQGSNDYYAILQSMLYDTLLAKVVSNDDTNYAAVKTEIETILKDSDLSAVFDAYIELLTTDVNGTILMPLFNQETTGSYYEDSKMDLLEILLNGYDEYTLEKLFNSLNTNSSSDVIKYKLYLEKVENVNTAKQIYINMIKYNSLSNNSSYLNTINDAISKYNFNTLINSEKTIDSSFSGIENTFENINTLQGWKYTPLSGEKGDKTQNLTTEENNLKSFQKLVGQDVTSLNVTPSKNYTSLWNIIKNDSSIKAYIEDEDNHFFKSFTNPTTGLSSKGIIALATEYNNTYQSNDRSELSFGIRDYYNSDDDYYRYGINTVDNYYNSSHHGVNAANKYMYLYTPDRVVSYRTNYYGPYENKNGDVFNAEGHLLNETPAYNLGVALNVTATTGQEFNRSLVPAFVSFDSNLVSEKIAASGSNYNSTLYTFHWQDIRYEKNDKGVMQAGSQEDFMWKDFTFVYQNPGNVQGMLYPIYDSSGNIKQDASNYIADGFNFAPDYVHTIQKHKDTPNTLPNGVETCLMNETQSNHTYRDYYAVGYISSAMVTGIWFNYSCYKPKEIKPTIYEISLNAKLDTGAMYNGFAGIHTTSYIGYTYNDLLKLDGVKTKGRCKLDLNDTNNLDEDEINIISAICTKLLETNEGKEKVLKAIANYAKDNKFTSSNANVLNMLISAVKDTNFANETVVSNISNILSLNYSDSPVMTIEQYLSNKNISNLSYKDRIIMSCTNDRANFRTLLLKLLNDVASKCIVYENYNKYIRDDLSNYLYKYFSYKYSQNNSLDWDDFDNWINALNDSDLSNINDLFDLSRDHLYLNNYNYTDEISNTVFTINDSIYYTSLYSAYDSLYDTDYDGVLVGETDYDGNTTGSNISFTTGNYQYGYDLYVVFNNGYVYLDDISNVTDSDATTEAEYLAISSNTNHVLYFNEGTEIYEIRLLNHEYTSPTYNVATATAPFAANSSVSGYDFKNVNIGEQKFLAYGAAYTKEINNNQDHNGSLTYTLTQSNIYYYSLGISFKILRCNADASNHAVTLTFNNNPITCVETILEDVLKLGEYGVEHTYGIYQYTATIPLEIINSSSSNTFTISTTFYNGAGTKSRINIEDLYVISNFDYVNGSTNENKTNVVFYQNVFAPYIDNGKNSQILKHKSSGVEFNFEDNNSKYRIVYKSYMKVTNSNYNCYVTINAGEVQSDLISFPQTNYTFESLSDTYKISSAPVFTPTYKNQSYEQGEEFYLSFPIENIDISLTLVDRLKNNYYNLLSDVGKYVIKDYFVKQTSNSQFVTNGVNSYVEFYATGNGTINIYDENNTVVETINVATESGVYNWFEYIASNNYTYEKTAGVTIDSVYVSPVGTTMNYTSNAPIDTLVANSSNTLINLDYSELKTRYNANKTISEDKIETYNLSYEENELFYLIFPYYRSVTGKTNEDLYEIDVYNTIITLMGTIKPKYYINSSYVNNSYNPKSDTNENYYTLFAHSDFDEEDWISLINKIALADYKGTDSALYKLVKGLDPQYYLSLLKDLCSEQGLDAVKYNTVTAVYNYAKKHLSSQLALYIYAAYLGDNYLDNSNLLKSTIMYTILNNFSNGEYQFITSNTTVDSAKVTALINYLSNNSNINIDGYGIFALSSSHGIGYGIFIPDNMDLSTLDVLYEMDDTLNRYVLISGTKSSKWRGGDNISSGAEGTVDYAFYHDMKQLILSISTDVFELDFDNSIYSVDDQINNATGEIIYYLSYPDFGTLYNKTSVTISYKSLANNAKLATIDSTSTNITDATTISLTGNNVTKEENKSIVVKNAFKVFAEDRSVSKNYTVKFIAAAPNSITLNLNPTSIGYNGGTITASVSGTGFPEGMDLEPYIRIIIGSTTYSSEDGYWMLDPEYINNAVVKNNTATIKVIIDKSLPGNDNITFRLAILGTNVDATFSKTKNTENEITTFEFEGKPITIADSMSSNILFGRAFNYTDLTAIYIKTTDTSVNTSKIYYVKTGDDAFAYKKVLNPVTADINTYYEKNADFYLNNLVCSVNAKVNITATKSTDAHGLMSYVVTFSVTSEFGSTRTYTHTLKEKNYFDNSTYAYLYADGERVTAITQEAYSALSEADRVKYLSDGTFTYTFNDDDFNGSASSSLADDLFMQVSFNRAKDREPQYRVKYTLSNFYTLGENVVFGPTTATSNNGATVNNTYAGLTVTVSNNNNTGKYVFVYSYTNKGIWENNTEYTRYYEFPELIVEKLASTDALLRKITFLEEAVSLGNTSTVILPNQVLVPTYEDQTVGYLSDDELYNDIFNSTSRKINVAHSGIQYGDYDAPQYTDYFAIGTVSNADLSYYCPTFAIEEHAQMYQYTTYLKLTEYGSGVQTKKDKVILTNHNNMYLYVPFTNGTVNEIFLVELTAAGYWTNVYRTTFNGKNASKTVDGKAVTVGAYNVSDKVTANNCLDAPLVAGYRVCDYAGQPTNNNSLFMDYVGTPLEGHFWYVSYVIFSEDKLEGGNLEGNVRYYHISIIDVTNNIQFYVKVYAPTSLNKKNLYLTISENIYDKSDKTLKTDTRQLSAYAVYSNKTYSGTRTDIAGYKIYNTQYDLQTLPSGYFYFHIDLPDGYVAKSYTSMKNQLIKYKQDGETIDEQASGNYKAEPGSFLPYSAIITQKVYLEIVVTEGTGANSSAWAVATSDIYTRDATYDGLIPAETQN